MSKEVKNKTGDKKPEANGSIGFHKFVPNLLTLMAMASGITAIQTAIHAAYNNGSWEVPVFFILVAGILDLLDGAVARLMKATSDFGAQLDSFSDFLSFGVAPAFILYLWVLNDAGKLGWIATLIFAMAVALRLARFNIKLENNDKPDWAKKYFEGVPSPLGAALALLPIAIWIQTPETFEDLKYATPLVAVWTMIVASLMISRLPTFSSKQIKVPSKMALPMMGIATFLIAALLHAPWITLTMLVGIYIFLIPVSIIKYKSKLKQENLNDDITDLAIGACDIDEFKDKNNRV